MIKKYHSAFPKISQFRGMIQSVARTATYDGLDENDEPIYNPNNPKPTLTLHGTVKLHGQNAGVTYDVASGEIWSQSREQITDGHGLNGFGNFVNDNKDYFNSVFDHVMANFKVDANYNLVKAVTIFGEWAGIGIQKGVAISELPKQFYVFAVKIKFTDEHPSQYIDHSFISNNDLGVYNVEEFPTWDIDVDFSMPGASSAKMDELVEQVENECPVAAQLGKIGLGEGIVWTTTFNGVTLRMKTKGEKHKGSSTKKSKVSIAPEKLQALGEFVERFVDETRFKQALDSVFGECDIDIKKLGEVIKWMINDIITEEEDTILASGLNTKDASGAIAQRTRNLFLEKWKV